MPNFYGHALHTLSNWHCADCSTGNLVTYIHTLSPRPANSGYSGGVFSPLQNRIYFVPYKQSDQSGSNWHYLDCSTCNVVAYIQPLSPIPVNLAYMGGVYSPIQNRVYFLPWAQAPEAGSNWHYVDCSTGNIETYIHTLSTQWWLPKWGVLSCSEADLPCAWDAG